MSKPLPDEYVQIQQKEIQDKNLKNASKTVKSDITSVQQSDLT